MKISIRWAVILGCILLVWGTQMIIMPFSIVSSRRVMLDHTRDIMENISDLSLEETRNFFSVARGAAHLTERLISSDIVKIDKGSIEELEMYFYDQLETYPQFAGIYFATPSGQFYYVNRESRPGEGGGNFRFKRIEYDENGERQVRLIWRDKNKEIKKEQQDFNDTYDPLARPWFQKAVREKKIIWTEPYLFFSSQKPGITTAGPLYDGQGKLTGVVGVDIELDVLSGFIGKLRVGKTGIAFIINKNEDVIAFPDLDQLKFKGEKGQFRLPKLNELSNPLCSRAFDSVRQEMGKKEGNLVSRKTFAAFESGEKNYYTMFTQVEESTIAWKIGVYIPEEDYLGAINANRRMTLFITLVVSVLATIGGLFVAGRMIRPIAELDQEARKIRDNDYGTLPRIQTAFDQIQRTADSFHDMKKAVISHKKELRKKEEIHRAIIDTANEAILMVDDLGLISYWNRAAQSLFGYDAAFAMGKSIHDLTPFQPCLDSEDLTLHAIFKERDPDKPLETLALRIANRKGQLVPAELSMASITIDQRDYTIAVIRDITARKKSEKEKMALWKQLQQARKMEAIGTLAGGIAHDFNNILSGILGYAEILEISLKGNRELSEQVNGVIMAGERARALVRQILAFSFQETRELAPLKVQSILNEACNLLAASLAKNITIEREIDEACVQISGDPTQIHQVALNLMTNGVQAMEQKGGVLCVGLESVELAMGGLLEEMELTPGKYVCYTVADTGVGIAPGVMDDIFDPYFTTKGEGRGTGLGLAVIKGIVQGHGGGIHVESSPGKGSRFRVFLPAMDTDHPASLPVLPARIQKGHEHVLLVDDQKEVIHVERQALEILGYRVTIRLSGREALETFKASPGVFDLVVTDMNMPGMSGEDLAEGILTVRPDTPIILLTGYSETMSNNKARSLGIKSLLMKPVRLKEFSAAIRNALES